jgi:alkanesulfonate monooxygenase SsuD/methylene tetrahydromethanopterin reductase-like flavin-dependent oxidoreductase (luciferase family)
MMHHALYLPVFGEFADAALLASLAADAEEAGWDGVFTWDHIAVWFAAAAPVVDATVAVTAMACSTRRIRLGALVTPLARRRPQKVARETATLDVLSGGRLVVGVGLGQNEHEFEAFGEDSDLIERGDRLDEALDVVTGLWSGAEIEHRGRHFTAVGRFRPTPLQRPRIPIWVAGAWPHRRPFRRAARYDGVVAMLAEPGPFDTPPEVYREALAFMRPLRPDPDAPFDVTHVHGDPDRDRERRRGKVGAYEEAGVSWWLEDVGPWRWGCDPLGRWPVDDMRAFVREGPAR